MQLSQIIPLALLRESVKASQIERKIKRTGDVFELRDIANLEICVNASVLDFFLRHADGGRREVHTRDLPARPRQCNDICACAATEVNGIAHRISLNEFKKFGG